MSGRKIISEAVDSKRVTAAQLSTGAGRSHAYIQQFLKRGVPAELPEHVRVDLAPLLGVNPDDLRESPAPAAPGPAINKSYSDADHDEALRVAPLAELPSPASMPRDLPVYGMAEGGPDGIAELDLSTDLALDRVRRPPGLVGMQKVFGLYISGESMSPWREPGDLVFVHPDRSAKPGSYAVAVLRPESEHGPRRALVKRFLKRSGGFVLLQQFNPDKVLRIPEDEVVALWRVIDWQEALGFT